MENRVLQGCVLALLLAVTGAALAERVNTDVVYLTNGDRVTGEIKSLDYASLKIETPNMGTISIEWPAVRSVASSQSFTIEDRDGGQYTGLLTGADENQLGMDLVTGDTVTVPLAEVVRMSQIETMRM